MTSKAFVNLLTKGGIASIALVMSINASALCWFNCNYAKTQNPIVLAHGLAGGEQFLGISDYWYGIEDYLENKGATVYVTEVSPVNSFVQRGEGIIYQLDQIRAVTGKPQQKFNLIGHSQGGLDIRYLAGVRPDLVASLTTVGTPHTGIDIFPEYNSEQGLDALLNFLGGAIQLFYALVGNDNEVDILALLEAFQPASIAEFNQNEAFSKGFPDAYCGEGEYISQSTAGPIYNFSWTGNKPVTNIFDPLDAGFALISLLHDEENDGLIEVCSTHFGRVIRDDYRMNHLDEVNLTFGLTSPFATDPRAIFRTHANRLKNLGL